MCGIWASVLKHFVDAETYVRKLSNRGPDNMRILVTSNYTLGFTHLSINGSAGMQPIIRNQTYVVCNGEIYNYKKLAEEYSIEIPDGGSDCSILPELFTKCKTVTEFCRALDGVFAMIVIHNGVLTAIRDPYGVRPLFMEGNSVFSSEVKGLPNRYGTISTFTPGCWYQHDVFHTYHTIPWIKQPVFRPDIFAASALQMSLFDAVRKRTMSDKPIGALLSGGLDSSVIVAILTQLLPNRLHTFSVGLPDSPDLKYARMVSDHCGTIHHELVITKQEYLDAIPAVIRDIESHDVTTVRASVGNWLIGKYIRERTDIKVVFNGDGSDEVGGGYKYFQRAPSDAEFEQECRRLLKDIHLFDVLRSDRCIASHGLEPRTPYLDKQFVATWLSIPSEYRRKKPEKGMLRLAFNPFLPKEIVWRPKEAFSDGMSECAPWKDIQNEEEYYKNIYSEMYPPGLIPYKWMPKWSPETTDPSARTLVM